MEGETRPKDAIEELDNLQLITSCGIMDLKEIDILADLSLDAEKVPLKAKQYKSSNGAIAEILEFEYETKGRKHAIAIMGNPKSDKKDICLLPKDHNDPEMTDISFKATKPGETMSKEYYVRLGKKK